MSSLSARHHNRSENAQSGVRQLFTRDWARNYLGPKFKHHELAVDSKLPAWRVWMNAALGALFVTTVFALCMSTFYYLTLKVTCFGDLDVNEFLRLMRCHY